MLDKLVNHVIRIKLDDIINYDFPLDKPFGLEIIHNGIIYDFIIKLSSNNKNLICFGSGHNGRNETDSKNEIKKPPFLNRWSYYKYYNESVIAYADPSFFRDEKITLGWYVGGQEWYLETISEIIKRICINQFINFNNVMFYGSSGGGFASIALATLIPSSKALVNNSSFDVRDISKQHYINLMDFLKKEFDGLSEEEIWEKISYRLNLNKLFERMEYIPEICIYTNIASSKDFEIRTKQFLKELFENTNFKNNLNMQYYYEPDAPWNGHNAMIHKHEKEVIKLFAKANLYNKDENNPLPYLKLLNNMDLPLRNLRGIERIDPKILELIIKFNTARVDIKNIGSPTNTLDIISTSDEFSKIMTPEWFKDDDGVGYVIESHANNLKIKFRCVNDGELKIILRSKYTRDINKKNFPIYIDYTKFAVNSEEILGKDKLIHCFHPHIYKQYVQNNDIIEFEINWLPFNSDCLFDI